MNDLLHLMSRLEFTMLNCKSNTYKGMEDFEQSYQEIRYGTKTLASQLRLSHNSCFEFDTTDFEYIHLPDAVSWFQPAELHRFQLSENLGVPLAESLNPVLHDSECIRAIDACGRYAP
jgi:hypothetical protein